MEENKIIENSEEIIAPETENTEIAVADTTAEKQPKKASNVGAGIKEWFRKLIVKLKRKTQLIPLVLTLITSFVFLCMIGTFSQMVQKNSGVPSLGICMFVATLASILILPIFLNAFPKNKKPVIPFIVGVFLVYALIIVMDVIFIVNMDSFLAAQNLTTMDFYEESKLALIVHIVLVGVCFVAFATLPLYKKAINMINTKKVVSSNDFSDEIDTSAEV